MGSKYPGMAGKCGGSVLGGNDHAMRQMSIHWTVRGVNVHAPHGANVWVPKINVHILGEMSMHQGQRANVHVPQRRDQMSGSGVVNEGR